MSFSGIHQIALVPKDQEKTSFITPTSKYYYNFMPFGLKDAESMYQIMVTKMFKSRYTM